VAQGVRGRLCQICQGRIALVTERAGYWGGPFRLELARAGATLAVADINEEKLALVAKEIEALGGTAARSNWDVSNRSVESRGKGGARELRKSKSSSTTPHHPRQS